MARRQISGGAPINKSRRQRRPQIVGGGARLYHCVAFDCIVFDCFVLDCVALDCVMLDCVALVLRHICIAFKNLYGAI